MRIQQIKTPTNWLSRSDDPARSLNAWIQGAWEVPTYSDYLIDDQRLGHIGTAVEEMSMTLLDDDTGMAFVAKDGNTLKRGFSALAKKVGDTNPKYTLQAGNGTGLGALYIEWNSGSIKSKTQIGAAVATIGHNTGQAIKRIGIAIFPSKGFLKRHGVTVDHFLSISKAMEQAGRDGKMVQRGAALYICTNSAFTPRQLPWGRTWRQIGPAITLSELKTLVGKLSA